jgi:hypothetical protein
MVLGGFWHGASWTFLAWGAYHGLILCVFRILGIKDPKAPGEGGSWARWGLRVVLMFHLTCLGWLFFRAENIGAAFRMGALILTDWRLDLPALLPMLVSLVLFALLPFGLDVATAGERRLDRLWAARPWVQAPVILFLVAMLLFTHASKTNEFIYFQF